MSLVYINSEEKPPNLKPVDAKEMIQQQQDTQDSVLIILDTYVIVGHNATTDLNMWTMNIWVNQWMKNVLASEWSKTEQTALT